MKGGVIVAVTAVARDRMTIVNFAGSAFKFVHANRSQAATETNIVAFCNRRSQWRETVDSIRHANSGNQNLCEFANGVVRQ